MMKSYEAKADSLMVYVSSEGSMQRPLATRLDVRNHSPDGFAWGYNGSGPAQLALAVLLDLYDDEEFACHYYQEFKNRVFARMDGKKGWTLTEDRIRAIIDEIQASDGA